MSQNDNADEWKRIDPEMKQHVTTPAGVIDVSHLDSADTKRMEQLAYEMETLLIE